MLETTYCCKDCGNRISWNTALYRTGLCKVCAFQGIRNPNYNNHKLAGKNNPNYGNKGHISGIKNPGWKNGISLIKPNCVDCGKQLSEYRYLRCGHCSHKGNLHIFFNKKRPNHSKVMSGNKNPRFGKPICPAICGKYKNIFMRSSYELNFAKWCDGSNIKWEYESKTFDLGDTTYTPDFYLPEFDCYIEIKGWMRPKNIIKLNLFKQKFPNINLKIFNQPILKQMSIIKE